MVANKEGRTPYGYDRVIVPNKREQKAISKMLKLHKQGATLGEIAKWLDENGYAPRRAKKWSKQAVSDVINRELANVD